MYKGEGGPLVASSYQVSWKF